MVSKSGLYAVISSQISSRSTYMPSIAFLVSGIGGSRGGVRDARPPWASKFFRFHAVFGKIWRVHAPPGGFTPPPRENPGSATGQCCQ